MHCCEPSNTQRPCSLINGRLPLYTSIVPPEGLQIRKILDRAASFALNCVGPMFPYTRNFGMLDSVGKAVSDNEVDCISCCASFKVLEAWDNT